MRLALARGGANFGFMLKQAMIFASVLSGALIAGILGYNAYQQRQQFTRVKAQLENLQYSARQAAVQASQAASHAALQADELANQLREQLTNSHARIEALLKEKEQVTRNQRDMEDQMRAALQDKEVTISELQGKLTVNILDRVLFDSGEAKLKPEGEKVLAQVASVLTQHTNRQVYVIGHTDNVPFRATPYSRYGSNWELSTARATSAVRYLVENAGVDPTRMAAVGYGEFHPIADNSTPEGRAKNRRIAIVIVPEQFNPLEEKQEKPEESQPIETPPAEISGPAPAPTQAESDSIRPVEQKVEAEPET